MLYRGFLMVHVNMFWLLYFLGVCLCTCSASSIANNKETDIHEEMGTGGFDLVMRLTSKMGSLSEKLTFMDKQLQLEDGRSRSSEIDLAVLKTREKCIQDEVKELKAAYGGLRDGSAEITELRKSVTKLQSVVDQLLLQRDAQMAKASNLQHNITQLESMLVSSLKEEEKKIAELTEKMRQLQVKTQQVSDASGGATFIRWGRTTCPAGNDVVYKGFAAGNRFDSKAGTANMLCLSEEPIYANHSEKVGDNYRSTLYGSEYETVGDPAFGTFQDNDMPCVVCLSQSKHSSLMVPGRNDCFPGWRMEYWGYLMGPLPDHASTQYICVDTDAESIAGGGANDNGNVLYLVESICGSLQCPPYKNGWELSCAVCTR